MASSPKASVPLPSTGDSIARLDGAVGVNSDVDNPEINAEHTGDQQTKLCLGTRSLE